MRNRKPLTDKDGEVRELLLEDMKRFRFVREVSPRSLLAKLGISRENQASRPTRLPLRPRGRRGPG
jgi:hypothetical protein